MGLFYSDVEFSFKDLFKVYLIIDPFYVLGTPTYIYCLSALSEACCVLGVGLTTSADLITKSEEFFY